MALPSQKNQSHVNNIEDSEENAAVRIGQVVESLEKDDNYELYGFVYKIKYREIGKGNHRTMQNLQRVELLWKDPNIKSNGRFASNNDKKQINVKPENIAVFEMPKDIDINDIR